MDFEMEEGAASGVGHGQRQRTFSNMSQQSSQSSKMNFPLMTCDSGLYTCSSNNSESDSDWCNLKAGSTNDDNSLRKALQDVRKLRSELERLTKSEQWYKQELRQQKSIRLEDLERIYSQERKFMQDNQRLQKECVRLYEKCSELERKIQKERQDSKDCGRLLEPSGDVEEEDLTQFEVQQQSALINDQQQLISVLRKQKKALLDDLRSLTEDKDEKVMEMQRLLADLELDNKRITKKCTLLSKERSQLESSLKKTDSNLLLALDEKLNLHKSLLDIREQLQLQERLVKLKEEEIAQLQVNFKDNMHSEQDLDEVHRLSMKYHEEINSKSLEIITLKNQFSGLQNELESLQEIQAQNDQQQRLIEQLNFSLEACRLELHELKESELFKSTQIEELQQKTDQLLQEKEGEHKQFLKQQQDFAHVCEELKSTNEQYVIVQEQYKATQFKLELLEINQRKLKFQSENDKHEILNLRQKLQEYLQQTSELVEKIQSLENKLSETVQANALLKIDFEKLQRELQSLKLVGNETENTDEIDKFNKDFTQLTHECEKLQNCLDAHSVVARQISKVIEVHNDEPLKVEVLDKSKPTNHADDLSAQCNKLLQNTDLLENILNKKENIIIAINSAQHSKDDLEKLVTENEILKKKIFRVENEAYSLRLKQDITEMSQKSMRLETMLLEQNQKVNELQKKLLKNDSKLFKMEKKLHILQETDNSNELGLENKLLKKNLAKEQNLKTDLNAQLAQVKDQVDVLKILLDEYKSKRIPTTHKSVQCDIEDRDGILQEMKFLKQQIVDLQDKQIQHVSKETHTNNDRLQLLQQLSVLQNSKVQCIEDNKRDWEDMLSTLCTVQSMEEHARRELELKRMELEDLNQVFAEQNEELRKLEEFTALLEFKRQQEREELKTAFQKEINVMKEQLLEYQQELKQQQELNQMLVQRNERIQQNYTEDYTSEIDEYKREVRNLKSKMGKTLSDKGDMLERIQELEEELKEIRLHQRDAVILPQFTDSMHADSLELTTDNQAIEESGKVNEDHLRVLTKVLEAEYDRKMQRYDQHIHSLLANVNALRKSLKINQEKTALLSEEQSRTLEEVKDLQKTKRHLEDLRFKYEQSQNTIRQLKQALALEQNKFESSDLGKSAHNELDAYEVANLIDDYKKLIQQSTLVTKRPTTSSILDLIQRSNQCMPNLQKLDANMNDLRCDLQSFLSAYTQKLPVTTLISTASLTVPPSLMDELRAASDVF